MQLMMSCIVGAIEALKKSSIHFTIADNAEVHDGVHGGVGVVLVQGSRQASSSWRADCDHFL